MKKILFLLGFAVIVMSFAGCAKSNHDKSDEKTEKVEKDTPEVVVKHFYSALQKGNIEKALSYTDLTKKEQQSIAYMAKEKMTDEAKEEIAAMKYKVGKAEIAEDGKTAKVEISTQHKDGSEDSEVLELERIEGDWKISIKKNMGK